MTTDSSITHTDPAHSNRHPPLSLDSLGVTSHELGQVNMLGDGISSDTSNVRLYTLGTFRLLIAQEPGTWIDLLGTTTWGHGRSLDVLLLLLMKGRPVARAEVAITLWPDADSARRARLMRNALWNVRQALILHAADLGDDTCAALALVETPYVLELQTQPAGIVVYGMSKGKTFSGIHRLVALDAAPKPYAHSIWCDALAFEQAATSVRPSHSVAERIQLRRVALSLYGGSFLPHRQGTGSEISWIAAYRARAQARRDQVVCDLALDLQRSGEKEQALDLLLRVLNENVLRAEVARRALLLLHDMGRLQHAIDLYERIRQAYRDAMRSEPEELKQVAAQLHMGRARPLNPSLR